jgi:hypothetical protein
MTKTAVIFVLLGLIIGCNAPSNQKEDGHVAKQSGFVSVFVNFGDREEAFAEIKIDSSVSVYQLLSQMKQSGSSLQMMDTLYGDLGHLVIGFNGVKNERPKYWVYCMNGAKANRGVDDMMLKNGDQITWYFTSETSVCKDKKEEL